MTASRAVAVRAVVALLLMFVPVLLAYAAIPRFNFGWRIEPEHRVVLSSILQQSLTVDSALRGAAAFAQAPPGDGDDLAQSGEFLALASPSEPALLLRSRESVSEALAYAPANPRAWTLLCELDAAQSSPRIVSCLDTAFALTQYDWFTAERRMRLVAEEWPFLDESLRDKAVNVVLPMWTSPRWVNGWTLQYVLYDLSRSANGRQLLRAGFIADRDALRSFNRFVIQVRTDGR